MYNNIDNNDYMYICMYVCIRMFEQVFSISFASKDFIIIYYEQSGR